MSPSTATQRSTTGLAPPQLGFHSFRLRQNHRSAVVTRTITHSSRRTNISGSSAGIGEEGNGMATSSRTLSRTQHSNLAADVASPSQQSTPISTSVMRPPRRDRQSGTQGFFSLTASDDLQTGRSRYGESSTRQHVTISWFGESKTRPES